MGAGGTAAARRPERTLARADARALAPSERAWIALWPCTLLSFAVLMLLGPPLGHALLGPRGIAFWPSVARVRAIKPEPTEHARFLLALAGVALLVAVVASGRPALRLRPALTRPLVRASRALAVAALLALVVAQHLVAYGASYGDVHRRVYFTVPTLLVAGSIAALLALAAARRERLRALARRLRETPRLRAACLALAALFTMNFLLTAVFFERTIGGSLSAVNLTLPFSLDETYAVLDGRTPLVDFHAQYGQLWPYLAAVPMKLLGASVGTYTIAMASATALVMLGIFATLRRVARSSALALALFLPFLATSFFIEVGHPNNRYGPENLFTIFPIRYGGPYALAWLTARHLDGMRPRRAAALFVLAALVAINNPEFGAGAGVATLAALVWARWPLRRPDALRLAARAGAGVLGGAMLVALGTLLRSGSLPRPGIALEFSRLAGVEGWTLLPMPPVGLHLVVFATFVAAVTLATVRALTRHEDALLTGMLAWAGTFGLISGSYFVGRSHPEVLIDMFSAWALALTLLVVAAGRAILAHAPRRPALPELAVLAGFGLLACSLAQTPAPWAQVARMRSHQQQPVTQYVRSRDADRFVAAGVRRGEKVLILLSLGHRTAYELGVENVGPYVSVESMPAVYQLRNALAALRAAGGHKVFLWTGDTWLEAIGMLQRAGFSIVRQNAHGLIEWSDA